MSPAAGADRGSGIEQDGAKAPPRPPPAKQLQILYANQDHRLDPQLRIRSIGGHNEDGTAWRLKIERAIAGIEAGEWGFHIVGAGEGGKVKVEVATHEGRRYLKAESDGRSPDSLLRLDPCPPDVVTEMLALLGAPLKPIRMRP